MTQEEHADYKSFLKPIPDSILVIHRENWFDVDLTDKMTEFDQTKHRFGILTKNPFKQTGLPMGHDFQALTLAIVEIVSS